jgi:hypothetical protein
MYVLIGHYRKLTTKLLASIAHDSSTGKYAQHNQEADAAENP